MSEASVRFAYRRALAAHRRAIELHETAAVAHDNAGHPELADAERAMATLEHDRLTAAMLLHPDWL